jgi:hypothetical protein
MNHLLLIASLIVIPQHNAEMPGEFYKIPEQIRERATVVILARYARGRTPCMIRPDGTRVWAVDSSFEIRSVLKGQVGAKSIRINASMLPNNAYVARELELKREYLVLLKPAAEKMKAVKSREGIGFWDALRDEEIIAIVETK